MTNFLTGVEGVLDSLLDTRDLPSGELGDVVVVPGILESTLNDRGGRQVWPSLDPTLDALRSDRAVSAPAVLFTCAPLQRILQAHWRVHMFPYDWRHSVRETADALSRFIINLPGTTTHPIHIVAHSMGGLIARLALRQGSELLRGGKLVMLGTPNHGSVLALAALTSEFGAKAFFHLLSPLVPKVDAMLVARTWPSVYELLPCPVHDPAFERTFAEPAAGLDVDLLAAAATLHRTLDNLTPPKGTIQIAGSGFPTADGLSLPGAGDGVVSHNRGLLPDIETFVVPGDHISLPANIFVLRSLTALLFSGSPGTLGVFKQRPRTA
jgi:pimeloyl-ACP methyl ester carboxylesterase